MKRGVSPTVSFVLAVALIVFATAATYLWASPLVSGINEPGRIKNLKNQMTGLDYMIRSTAHGDLNFTNSYEMYAPDTYVELREGNDSIAMTFTQKASVMPRAVSTQNKVCRYDVENLNDTAFTGMALFRDANMSRVYYGAKGEYGDAAIVVCYTDINLEYSGTCSRGKQGDPRITVYIRKYGFDADKRPIIQISVC